MLKTNCAIFSPTNSHPFAVLITFLFWFLQWKHPAASVSYTRALALWRLSVPRWKGSRPECGRQRVRYPALRMYIQKCSNVNFDVCNPFDSGTLLVETPRFIRLVNKGTLAFVSFSLKRERTWMQLTTSRTPSPTQKHLRMQLCELFCLYRFDSGTLSEEKPRCIGFLIQGSCFGSFS